jgi:thioesterase domain-containing protein
MLRGPLRVFATSLRTQYQPAKPYPGPVQLVVADNAKLDGNANRLEHELNAKGWKRWAPNLACLHASGNHMTMLKEPHVRSLVQLSGLVAKAFSIAGS